MADMYGAVKSNTFRVKNLAKFKKWFDENASFGGEIETWFDSKDNCSFGGYEQYPSAWPHVPYDPETDNVDREWDLEAFAKELRPHLRKGEVFQVVAAGHEKLRYVAAGVLFIDATRAMFLDVGSDSNLPPSILTAAKELT